MPSCSSGFQLARTCSIPSTVRPSPSIGSGTGLIPLGQAVLRSQTESAAQLETESRKNNPRKCRSGSVQQSDVKTDQANANPTR